MMKTDLDTFLKFIDQTGKQKHFRKEGWKKKKKLADGEWKYYCPECQKGCDYCLKTNPEYAGYSNIWHDNKLSIGYGNYIEINFCPICGRYLRRYG